MAIQLNAEQKYMLKIFGDRTIYKIPPYQRAYSWGEDECEELFDDLVNAFTSNTNDGYFLGNIILSTSKKDEFEVIDGQQRLTTMTILLKILYGLDKNNQRLKSAIWLLDDRSGEKQRQRVETNIFIENDHKAFGEILSDSYDEAIAPKDKKNIFYNNIHCLYKKVFDFSQTNNIQQFIDFILYDVSMLPIIAEGNDSSEAREKALKVFETTNNRGIALDDSDIFKSILYYMANRNGEDDKFIELWKSFDEKCNNLDDSRDNKIKLRIFRIYSYMIRGKEGIKSAETGLRDFFSKTEYSPFKNKTYQEIFNDLNSILDAIVLFENTKNSNKEISKWFQLIDLYSNLYPKDTIIVYLVKNQLNTNEKTKEFAKNLVRDCYAKGATSTIKFDMYSLIVKIMYDEKLESKKYTNLNFEYFGMLYKGFGLLGVYLNKDQEAIYPYEMIRLKDIVEFKTKDYTSFDYIGNIIPSNLTIKELNNIEDIKVLDLLNIVQNRNDWDKDNHFDRIKMLKDRYKLFFEDEI
ncbi:DUF262 domain-containing protein [Campylobacter sp. RM12920]|uniref:DUF262 domain-containing protein n=1 Tax=Campylobacter californiensis TaxID=1032243 RepID=A0ABD4JJ46_9BACT|nr:DUF262 domain-containing protein [Campylobacter sp. RM12919]MBE2988404.1 DUF262 domain-containing protein [Campylobacter sp. RM12920]